MKKDLRYTNLKMMIIKSTVYAILKTFIRFLLTEAKLALLSAAVGFLVKISSLFNIAAYPCGWETHREPYHIGDFIRRNGASIWKKSHIAWTVSDNKLGSVRSLHRKKQSRVNVRAIHNKYNNETKFLVYAENNPHVPTGISKLPIKRWPLCPLLVCDTRLVFRKTRSVSCENQWRDNFATHD